MARLKDKVDCERVIRAAGRFELKFFCPDPFSYAVEDENFVLTETGTHTVTRLLGNIESAPVYALQGELTKTPNNYISVSVSGAEMKLVNASLSPGETLLLIQRI